MSKYHGFRKGETVIGIGYIPNRKQPAIYIQRGHTIKPLAYMSEENAEELLRTLDEFFVTESEEA